MIREAIILSFLVGLASCDYLGSIFDVSVISAIRSGGTPYTRLGKKGHVENCSKYSNCFTEVF